MSAFHPITTEQRTPIYVGSVPKGDIPLRLLDHLVGGEQEPGWNLDTERLGRG